METYASLLNYAILFFVALIVVEFVVSRIRRKSVNYGLDTIASLSSGMTNTIKDVLGLGVVILSYEWMVSHWALVQVPASPWVYAVAFVLTDFAAYWSHRWNHEINLFWNRHIIHHSSEEFNLAAALRQSISGIVGIYFFLSIPMALMGIPAEVVAIVAPLHLFAQFWYHTRLIGRMGWLEHVLVTPSHHRVHHAINPEYIDKNYAAIFIVWDKWFGTFQVELEDVPPVYGVKRPVRTWNPILINFMHLWQLCKDAWYARRWWDKLRIWFMPTGWRPADVAARFPVFYYQDDVYAQEKYRVDTQQWLLAWFWVQLVLHVALEMYLFGHIGDFGYGDILAYGIFLGVSIFAYTSLMDRHWIALPFEVAKIALGLFLMYRLQGWYAMDQYLPGATGIMIAYLLLSLGVTSLALSREWRSPKPTSTAGA